MARTRKVARRTTGGLMHTKVLTGSESSGVSSGRGRSRLNRISPREKPSWQKPITNFLTAASKSISESNNEPVDDRTDSSNTTVVKKIRVLNINDINSKYQKAVMEQDVACGKSAENNASNENATDTEMKKSNDAKMEKSDIIYNELVVPQKKIRLNKEVYKHLKAIEQGIYKF